MDILSAFIAFFFLLYSNIEYSEIYLCIYNIIYKYLGSYLL